MDTNTHDENNEESTWTDYAPSRGPTPFTKFFQSASDAIYGTNAHNRERIDRASVFGLDSRGLSILPSVVAASRSSQVQH